MGGKVEPSKSKRAKFGLLSTSRIQKINKTFTLQERQDAVEYLLQAKRSVGFIQAIIDFQDHPVLDINICNTAPTKVLGFKRSDPDGNVKPSMWLQLATEKGLEDHVQLLASREPDQWTLDDALAIAISKGSKAMVTRLLQYGADINTCRQEFMNRSINGDMQWTELLLSSPHHPVDQLERDDALAASVQSRDLEMAHLLLTFGADVNHSRGLPIKRAIQQSDLRMTILLISTPSISDATLRRAIKDACTDSVYKDSTRLGMVNILLLAGVDIPRSSLGSLLRIAMSANDTSLVALLIRYNQISAIDATTAMEKLSTTLPEEDVLHMSELLLKAGAQAIALGSLLYWAVKKDYDRMIALLCEYGVSIDFENAISIRFALQRHDTKLLNVLLSVESAAFRGSTSTNTVLATVLPQALGLSSKNKRRQAVQLLLQKGVKGPFVDQALLDVVTNPSICDFSIVSMLLEGAASVNYYKGGENCLLSAAQDGSLTIVNLLAAPERGAMPQLLSFTIQHLYHSRAKSVHSDLVKTMEVLLQRGADCSDDTVAQTLVSAIRAADDDENATIVRLLLQYSAEVNYNNGQPIQEAIRLTNDGILTSICTTNRINESSFSHAIQPAIKTSRIDQSKLSILLHHCKAFTNVTGDALIAELTEGPSGGQDEIVRILLENGADVNRNEGMAFSKAIEIVSRSKSLGYLRLLLAQSPLETALRTAFTSARKLNCPLSHRYEIFRLILEAGFNGKDINIALAETINSNQDDLTIPRLLLHHKADVNHEQGSILISATDLGNIQMVAVLLAYGPVASTVDRSFKVACHAQTQETHRIKLFQCLLTTNLVSREAITYALTHAVTKGNKDKILLAMLCRHKPRVEVPTLLSLIRDNDVSTTQFLLKARPPTRETCSHAFTACLDLERDLRLAFAQLFIGNGLDRAVWAAAAQKAIENQDSHFLDLLLLHSSNRHAEIDAALVLAANTFNTSILRALLLKGPDYSARDQAFENMLTSQKMQSTTESKSAAIALLEYGISQSLRDRALLQSFESYRHNGSDFYQVLLEHGADVTIQTCICFTLAGQFEDLDIFCSLLQPKTDFDLVIKSLIGQFPQERYERLVELIYTTVTLPFYNSKRRDVSVIFDAMHRFGQGVGLIRLLLEHGYPAGQTLRSGERDSGNSEPVTPVIWALGQPEEGVSDDVILTLLKSGQSGFTTKDSGASAITLAAQRGRHAILRRLIELNVDVSAVDRSGLSPLFHATVNTDEISVSMLLENGTQPNDGSLHEAARLCQKGMLKWLLEKGHDPDYACDLHEGRTALGELCSEATVKNGEEASATYETIKLLINAPADLSFRTKGKTVLHLALENEHPIDITRALLRFPEIYKDLRTDSEVFVYENDHGRFMSPDLYAQYYCSNENCYKPQLIAILESKCKTKWFTKTGIQLQDCKGLPRELEEMKKQQDLADQAEHRAIQRRQRDAQNELHISQNHHRNNMLQSREQADLNLFNAQRLNDQQIAHDSRASEQRRLHSNLDREAERYHIQESHRLTYNAAQQTRQLEYTSQQQLKQLESSSQNEQNQQRYAALQREAAHERNLIEDREAAEKRSQTRAIERMARQDESVRLITQEQRGLIAAAKEAKVDAQATKLPALTWNEDVD
ncbi:hypothetical protein J4E91_005138 [Alternaria rosae]|nr:hypothetical protein J4E91_005138 [Alternaria rosae]